MNLSVREFLKLARCVLAKNKIKNLYKVFSFTVYIVIQCIVSYSVPCTELLKNISYYKNYLIQGNQPQNLFRLIHQVLAELMLKKKIYWETANALVKSASARRLLFFLQKYKKFTVLWTEQCD